MEDGGVRERHSCARGARDFSSSAMWAGTFGERGRTGRGFGGGTGSGSMA
jgi:hypothetical protein